MAKRQQKQQKPQLVRRTIEDIPLFTEAILGTIAATDDQFNNFIMARHRPHVLDDDIIDRAQRAFEEQLAGVPNFRQQLNWILEDELTDAQRYQVEDLLAKLLLLQRKTEVVLALVDDLRAGTINRILGMDDEELAAHYLRGELGEF